MKIETLGIILVAISFIIALFNPIMGIVAIFLFFIFVIVQHYTSAYYKNPNDPDNPFIL